MPDLCGIDVLYQCVVCTYNGVIVHMVVYRCNISVWCVVCVAFRCIGVSCVVNQCVVRTYGVAQLPPSHKSNSSCSLYCELKQLLKF